MTERVAFWLIMWVMLTAIQARVMYIAIDGIDRHQASISNEAASK